MHARAARRPGSDEPGPALLVAQYQRPLGQRRTARRPRAGLELDADASPALLGSRCFFHAVGRGILTATATRD